MKFGLGVIVIAVLGLGIFKLKDFKTPDSTKHVTQPIFVKAIYSMPVSYDPIKMNDGASLIFSELVYDGLLRSQKITACKQGSLKLGKQALMV